MVILISICQRYPGTSHAAPSIQGAVRDETGAPIEGAEVFIYVGNNFFGKTYSDGDGAFEFEAEPGANYTLYTIADNGVSPGNDFLPSQSHVSLDQSANIVLRPAGSLVFSGDIQFIDSENLPTSFVYAIMEPATGEVIEVDGLPLIYGSDPNSLTEMMMLGDGVVIIPADTPFELQVNATVLIENILETRPIIVSESPRLRTIQGREIRLDIRKYSRFSRN
jgi:hypothetical protein